jgi:glycosyltransferase involved in cell wall biosynthesis
MNDTSRAPVTVVIPAFNQKSYIEECILSAVEQSAPPTEIIVVDDGSSDSTFTIAQKVTSAHRHARALQRPNGGAAAARNTGLAEAKSEYVLFLDSDDRLHKDAIEKHLRAFSQTPDSVMVFGSNRTINPSGQIIGENAQAPRFLSFEEVSRRGSPCPSQCLYRRDALNKVSGYDDSILAAEDADLNIRLRRIGSIYCHADMVMDYREHSHQMTKNLLKIYEGRVAGLEKQFGPLGISPDPLFLRDVINETRLYYSKRQLRSLAGAIRYGRWADTIPAARLCIIGWHARIERMLILAAELMTTRTS